MSSSTANARSQRRTLMLSVRLYGRVAAVADGASVVRARPRLRRRSLGQQRVEAGRLVCRVGVLGRRPGALAPVPGIELGAWPG